ncbi:MAG: YggS family pyridoxal phosphate-dependent enzyme [Gemmatimonadales bacterium]
MAFPGLVERVGEIRDRIRHHQARGGWGHAVRIVAVTKSHGPETVRAAAGAGLLDIGENRVQEALAKQDELRDLAVRWHLIGPLQRNKARHVVGRFAMIHAVDRAEIALELAKRIGEGPAQPVLVEVNCSEEARKAGVEPGALPALLDVLRSLPALEVRGLMTLAELTQDESRQRRAFATLRELRDRLATAGHDLPELSMGMSGDFGVAVEEGATMVRLGTLLFGERAP